MKGLITERHFRVAEKWFPGIRAFYLAMACKPATFLELVWEYEKETERSHEEAVVNAEAVPGLNNQSVHAIGRPHH
jgi:hypothetical protein